MAKGFKSGGRKPGTPNRVTQRVIAQAARSGTLPLDFLLSVMRNKRHSMMLRVDAAGKAAQYVHPKLAMIEHSGAIEHKHVSELSLEELDSRIAALTGGTSQENPGPTQPAGVH